MEGPMRVVGEETARGKTLGRELAIQAGLAERLPNIAGKIAHLEALRTDVTSARAEHPDEDTLHQVDADVAQILFDLRNAEVQIESIEERLGQGQSEPVDMTLQQTLDVVQQLRRLSENAPNDDRLAMVSTNIAEGLESFVTSVLSEAQPSEAGRPAGPGPNPSDLTMVLEVIGTIQIAPGPDRTSTYKTLRQQFIDAACKSAWARLDLVRDPLLDRSTKKEYLHEALTIWGLLPDLSENSGSPRLSRLPQEALETVEQLMLREVIGSAQVGDPRALLDAALLARGLVEDYIPMVPAIPVEDAQAALGQKARDSLVRRVRAEILRSSSWQELETCLAVVAAIQTISGADSDVRIGKLSRQVRLASLRLRFMGVTRALKRAAIPIFATLAAIIGLSAGYIGLAVLIQRLYEYNLPLAP
jgi:hypothetical protein